ncbi:Sugar/inositol transporter [Corchorus capsularis]|uniref:Sugar/inositol transporter n=1 Tax=Corchorus capsularis TaxID=210143 RepID=A0A1R3I5D5_COCAP|nr:Sugar/inositol transporter [Corchorus capsularis]
MAIKEDIERGNNNNISCSHEEVTVALLPVEQKNMAGDEEDGQTDSSKASLWMVYLSTFVAVCGSFEFGSCAGYSSPTQNAIREDLSLTLAEAMRTATIFCVGGWLAIYFAQVVITGLNTTVIDKGGRKPLLLVSSTGLIIGCILTGISFYLKDHNLALNAVPILAVAGILIYISSFSAGMGAVPWVVMSEIFPINIKGVAGSLATLVNWFGAWAVSYTFNFLMDWSSYGTFILYAAINALGILFIVTVVPETKGKTLEQIQAAINV